MTRLLPKPDENEPSRASGRSANSQDPIVFLFFLRVQQCTVRSPKSGTGRSASAAAGSGKPPLQAAGASGCLPDGSRRWPERVSDTWGKFNTSLPAGTRPFHENHLVCGISGPPGTGQRVWQSITSFSFF
jgi:hypothetical protein